MRTVFAWFDDMSIYIPFLIRLGYAKGATD